MSSYEMTCSRADDNNPDQEETGGCRWLIRRSHWSSEADAMTWEQLGYEVGLERTGQNGKNAVGCMNNRKCIACRKGWANEKASRNRKAWAQVMKERNIFQARRLVLSKIQEWASFWLWWADKAAKEAAGGEIIQTARWTSLIHLKRQIIGEKKSLLRAWHNLKMKERESRKIGFYVPWKQKIDPLLGKTKSSTHRDFTNWKSGMGLLTGSSKE